MKLQGRSYLFVPGNRPDRFDKACASGADAVIIDLEDAVASENKDTARDEVRRWLQEGNKAYVRINAVGTQWFEDDCSLLQLPGMLGVMLPKAEDRQTILKIGQEKHAECELLLLIETAKGLHNAAELAQTPFVSRLAFGSVDFQLDCSIPDEELGLVYARSVLVVASAVGALPPPIDGVTTALDDFDLIFSDSNKGKALGFSAKLCIHPKQVETVNKAFLPTEQELQQAKRILEAAAHSKMTDAARLDGKLLEKPIITWAERILAMRGENV